MRKHGLICFVLFLLLSVLVCAPGMAESDNTLVLPEGTEVIEAEAFYGDTSIGDVILPEGLREIGSMAFACSSVKKENCS